MEAWMFMVVFLVVIYLVFRNAGNNRIENKPSDNSNTLEPSEYKIDDIVRMQKVIDLEKQRLNKDFSLRKEKLEKKYSLGDEILKRQRLQLDSERELLNKNYKLRKEELERDYSEKVNNLKLQQSEFESKMSAKYKAINDAEIYKENKIRQMEYELLNIKAQNEESIKAYKSQIEELKKEKYNLKIKIQTEHVKEKVLLIQEKEKLMKEKNLLEQEKANNLKSFHQLCSERGKEISQKAILKTILKELNTDRKLLMMKVKDIPLLAKHFMDLEDERTLITQQYLMYKKNPAIKASEEIAAVRNEKKKIIEKLKTAEYKLWYYEQLIPWLHDLDDDPVDSNTEKQFFNTEYDNKEDAAGYWLTKDEYSALSNQEKYQLALERYCNRNKTNSEIGREFERYIGYLYELKGYDVEYRGIIDGFDDRGRDLICTKDGKTLVVQCKYWSKKKTIHENHINQLFGTTVRYFIEKNPEASFVDYFNALVFNQIEPVFITSTVLSDTAKAFAKSLDIKVMENVKMEKYPMIKCNISGRENERIYHLPFDQQYDKVKIDRPGEFFAMTVEEAEAKGFRRAKKWTGS